MAMRDRAAEDRFERLYLLARDPLARYLARRAAPDAVEDLFAEVMAIAWRRRTDMPDEDQLPWLYGTARRVLANHRRSASRFGRLVERLNTTGRAPAVDPFAPQGPDVDLAAGLAALAPDDAEILRLWAWEELAPREIAVTLGITPNAASIRLHRAKARLRGRLEGGLRKDGAVPGHLHGVERKEAR